MKNDVGRKDGVVKRGMRAVARSSGGGCDVIDLYASMRVCGSRMPGIYADAEWKGRKMLGWMCMLIHPKLEIEVALQSACTQVSPLFVNHQ